MGTMTNFSRVLLLVALLCAIREGATAAFTSSPAAAAAGKATMFDDAAWAVALIDNPLIVAVAAAAEALNRHDPTVATADERTLLSAESRRLQFLPPIDIPPAPEQTFPPSQMPTSDAPTAFRGVPAATAVVATAASTHSITVSLELLPAAPAFGGLMHCLAIKGSDAVIHSVQQVITAAQQTVPYSSGTTQVTTDIAGLQELTVYSIFCAVQSNTGAINALDAVRDSRLVVTTACCRSIDIVNAPAYFYTDTAVYSLGQKAQYTFKYRLSSPPPTAVVIAVEVLAAVEGSIATRRLTRTLHSPKEDRNRTGKLNFAGYFLPFFDDDPPPIESEPTYTSVSAVPEDRTFTSSSTDLTGEFIIESSATLPLVLRLYAISGASAGEFNESTIDTLALADPEALPPPPVLKSARFTDSGAGLVILFDAATNRGGVVQQQQQGGRFACNSVFDFASAEAATCSWLNSTAVRVTFTAVAAGAKSLLELGGSVFLRNNTAVTAICDATRYDCTQLEAAASAIVPALVPFHPMKPSPVLKVPSLVSSCSAITIDATLSGGSASRLWTTTAWFVTSSDFASNSGVAAEEAAIVAVLESYGKDTNQLIALDPSLFRAGVEYTVVLQVSNFLGQIGSTTAAFIIESNPNLPLLTLESPSVVTVTRSEELRIASSTMRSNCSDNPRITFQYSLLLNGTALDIPSKSRDPTIFSLDAYELEAGSDYTLLLTATAEATANYSAVAATAALTVQVIKSDVVAVIGGGSSRQLSRSSGSNMLVDASASFDQNIDPSLRTESDLMFQWSCSIASVEEQRFGSDCSDIFVSLTTRSYVQLNDTRVLNSLLYEITVRVTSSADSRRSATAHTVIRIIDAAAAAVVAVTSATRKFNADAVLNLFALAQAESSHTLTWKAFDGGEAIELDSLTPTQQTLRASELIHGLPLALSVPGGTFAEGSVVTFRLTAQPVVDTADLNAISFAEVTVEINSPPSGGLLSSDPQRGIALTTDFLFLMSLWSDDSEDLPLSYDFRYQVTPSDEISNAQSIAQRSAANFVLSKLPAGTESEANAVTIVSRVFDSLGAAAATFLSVTVTATATAPSSLSILRSGLSIARRESALRSDLRLLQQVINTVAATIDTVNCSLASNAQCASLNRQSCTVRSHTCGRCFKGFSGSFGESNAPCIAISDTNRRHLGSNGEVGSVCTIDADCQLGECSNAGICAVPLKTCLSSSGSGNTAVVCSGHGDCKYRNGLGSEVAACSVLEPVEQCIAACQCNEGFGGADCSLDAATLNETSAIRGETCDAIADALIGSDDSAELVAAYAVSLLRAFDPAEVVTATGTASCFDAISRLAQLAAKGLLIGSQLAVAQQLLDVASDFLSPRVAKQDEVLLSDVFTKLAYAATLNSVINQREIELISPFARVKVVRQLASNVTELRAPAATVADADVAPYVEFASSGSGSSSAEFCDGGNGYLNIAVVHFPSAPVQNKRQLSSLLEVQSNPDDTVGRYDSSSPSAAILSSSSSSSSSSSASNAVSTLTSGIVSEMKHNKVAYYVIIHYTAVQDLLLSTEESLDEVLADARSGKTDVDSLTFPSCSVFNGYKYVDCDSCVVSSYTNFNVTFACTDIRQLCPQSNRQLLSTGKPGSRSKRLLQIADDDLDVQDSDESPDVEKVRMSVLLQTYVTTFQDLNSTDFEASLAAVIVCGSLLFVMLAVLVKLVYLDCWNRSSITRTYHEQQRKIRQKHREELQRALEATAQPSPAGDIEAQAVNHAAPRERFGVIVDDFLDSVLPPDSYRKRAGAVNRFVYWFIREHDFISPMIGGSRSTPRAIRWLVICMDFLTVIFVDTLIFSTFYLDNGDCEKLNERDSCLLNINRATGESECEWIKDDSFEGGGRCQLNPPPSNLQFRLFLLAITLMIVVPVQSWLQYLLIEYCARRPNFDLWSCGWLTESLCGPSTQTILEGTVDKGEDDSLLLLSFKALEAVPSQAPSYMEQQHTTSHLQLDGNKESTEQLPQQQQQEKFAKNTAVALLEFTVDALAANAKALNDSTRSIDEHARIQKHSEALLHRVGMRVDGTPAATAASITDRLLCRSAVQRLTRRIESTRRNALRIRTATEEVGCNSTHYQEVALMQYFVLEQFSPLKQYVLRNYLFQFDYTTAPSVHPGWWIAAWLLIVLPAVASIVWMFAWAVSNGNTIVQQWGVNLAIAFGFDAMVAPIVRVFVMYELAMRSIRPQLRVVHEVLQTEAMSYGKERPSSNEAIDSVASLNVEQYLSPTCCVASLDSPLWSSASAHILRRISDVDVFRCKSDRVRDMQLLPLALLSIPVAVGIFSEVLGDKVMDSLIPVSVLLIIVVTSLALSKHYVLVLLLYLLPAVYCIWRGFEMISTQCGKQQQPGQQQQEQEEDEKESNTHTMSDTGSNQPITPCTRYFCTAKFCQFQSENISTVGPATVCDDWREQWQLPASQLQEFQVMKAQENQKEEQEQMEQVEQKEQRKQKEQDEQEIKPGGVSVAPTGYELEHEVNCVVRGEQQPIEEQRELQSTELDDNLSVIASSIHKAANSPQRPFATRTLLVPSEWGAFEDDKHDDK